MNLTVCARKSPLSLTQVKEVFQLLGHSVPYTLNAIDTTGDLDQTTSLQTMGKTDFFTKELDGMILNGKADVAIHSAKDLPDPLPHGLEIIAITKGVDPSDSLVMREGDTIESLAPKSRIATSSPRREDMVKQLRSDFLFIDLRGTIEKRLELLSTGKADGVVVAEAALIRLNLTHLNRITLPGETVEGQGQLAIVAKTFDLSEKSRWIREIFSPIDSRGKVI